MGDPMPFNLFKSVRRAVVGGLFATLVLSISGTAAAAGTVRIAGVVWIGYSPFYVAEALDLYKKYDTKVTIQQFSDLSLIPSAVSSGKIEGGLVTYDVVVGTAARGIKQKVVAPVDYSNGGDAILATKDIAKFTDIKGKKVGFNPITPSDFLLSFLLKKNGMTAKDIKSVNMSADAVPAAMASGGVPVGVTWEPNVSKIAKMDNGNKFHVIATSKETPGLIADVLIFEQKYIDAHPNEIKAVIQGYVDGLNYMNQNPDKAAELIAKAMGITVAEVKEQLPTIHNPSLQEMMGNFTKDGGTTSFHTNGQVIADVLIARKQIKKAPPFEITMDDRFVKELLGSKK
jgi:NitT/TauT family transport system substrate-binding protein